MSAHHAMGAAFDYMKNDMKGKLGRYMISLEHRYGDPAVYEAQREEMAAEQAAVIHSEVKSREEALSTAYQKDREEIRRLHNIRMGRPVRDRVPQYLEPDPSQTARLPVPADPQLVAE